MFLDFFHLREEPFGVTPDPAYLYASRTHCEALDALTEGILDGRGFLALIAEPGMGKTTLLYQVLEGLRDSARAVFLFQTQCNSREFFQYLLSELGVDSTGMGLVAMHNKLNEMLFEEMLAGKRFVLVVDEAQNLDGTVLETIRLLSNFETSNTKLLQIVLAGQPQLGEKLRQQHLTQLLQRITVVRQLEALSEEETAGYIRHRLKVAGHSGEALFEPEAVKLIHARSLGVPRTINKICYRALLEAYADGSSMVSREVVEKADRKFAVVATPRPANMLAPLQLAMVADSLEKVADVPATPELTYKPRTQFALPAWGLWVCALIGVLLTGGLALPRNTLQVVKQRLHEEVAAARNLAKSEHVDDRGPLTGAGGLSQNRDGSGALVFTPGTPNVTAIQTSNAENDARVVVLLDDMVQYDSARIVSPDRIYFDLHKARMSTSLGQNTLPGEAGLLKGVRAAQYSDDVVRLVLDADGAKDYSAQVLSNPYRLVIDVHAQPAAVANANPSSNAIKQSETDAPQQTRASQGSQLSLARELGLKITRIAIDPGHGGYDTGTKGPQGLLEKDLCLDVALRLGRLIEENIAGAEVVYTRRDDRHVSLEARTAIANSAKADLFISIHANSSDFHEARGVETYYLNLATSPQSRELAMLENASGQASLHELSELIEKITRNDKIAESKLLAVDIQDTLSRRLQLVSSREKNRGVKQAPFVVLTGATMPAVLSEISFVSNSRDEILLLESSQRQRVADGLYGGIAAYLDGLHSLPRKEHKLVSENRPATTPGFTTSVANAAIGRNRR
jgi:N-acetylmuramoyl-L-alanine amidase/type II secretory pathway predicted ATPase ExeA